MKVVIAVSEEDMMDGMLSMAWQHEKHLIERAVKATKDMDVL